MLTLPSLARSSATSTHTQTRGCWPFWLGERVDVADRLGRRSVHTRTRFRAALELLLPLCSDPPQGLQFFWRSQCPINLSSQAAPFTLALSLEQRSTAAFRKWLGPTQLLAPTWSPSPCAA